LTNSPFFSIRLFAKQKISEDVTWHNSEDQKIPIIDGKIRFYDKTTGARYEIWVTQVKGQGVASADKLKKLTPKHSAIITSLLIRKPKDNFTSDEIIAHTKFDIFDKAGEGKHPYFKEQHFRATISELTRKKILTMNNSVFPPRYCIDFERAEKSLESGKFV